MLQKLAAHLFDSYKHDHSSDTQILFHKVKSCLTLTNYVHCFDERAYLPVGSIRIALKTIRPKRAEKT